MSRSRKKHPGHYITTINHGVRKKEKTMYNRVFRRITKHILKKILSTDVVLKNKIREVCDLWTLAQDGDYIHNKDDYKYKIK